MSRPRLYHKPGWPVLDFLDVLASQPPAGQA
jgi:hypothetical protein